MIAYLDLGLDSICLLAEVLKVIPANGHSHSHQLSATTLLLRIALHSSPSAPTMGRQSRATPCHAMATTMTGVDSAACPITCITQHKMVTT